VNDRPVRWGLGDAIIGFVAGVLLSGIAAGVVAAITGDEIVSGKSQPLPLLIASLVGLWIGLFGICVLATRRKGLCDLALDFGLRIAGWRDAAIGAAAGVLSQWVLLPLVYLPFFLFDSSLRHKLDEPAKQLTGTNLGGAKAVVLFVFLAIGAPVVEELFFRGLLLRALDRRLGPIAAIPISAVAFALAHENLITLPGLTAFGLVLGILAYRTGRLGPGIVAHMAFNALTVLTLAAR
jgi:uncharacterized protein